MSILSKIAQAFGLVRALDPREDSHKRECARSESDCAAQILKQEIASKVDQRTQSNEKIARLSNEQVYEADVALRAIRGVVDKLETIKPDKRSPLRNGVDE